MNAAENSWRLVRMGHLAPAPRCLDPNSRCASPASGGIAVSVAQLRRLPGGRGENPAINRCMQVPDQTARRVHAAFAGWCSRVSRCCSLRSLELRSRGGSAALRVHDQEEAHLTSSAASGMTVGTANAGLSSAFALTAVASWALVGDAVVVANYRLRAWTRPYANL